MNPILDREHVLKYLGGDVIGKVANDLEGVFPCKGPVEREDIGLDDVEVLGCIIVVLQEVFVEVTYKVAVKFDGDHFSGQGQQDPGQLPGAWSELTKLGSMGLLRAWILVSLISSISQPMPRR